MPKFFASEWGSVYWQGSYFLHRFRIIKPVVPAPLRGLFRSLRNFQEPALWAHSHAWGQ